MPEEVESIVIRYHVSAESDPLSATLAQTYLMFGPMGGIDKGGVSISRAAIPVWAVRAVLCAVGTLS